MLFRRRISSSPSAFLSAPAALSSITSLLITNTLSATTPAAAASSTVASPDTRYAKSKRALLFEGKVLKNDDFNPDNVFIPRDLWKDHPDAGEKRRQRAALKQQNQNSSNTTALVKNTSTLREMLVCRIFDTSLPPLKIIDIFNKVTTPWRLLDEYNVPSRRKRLQRLSTILRFLQDHNVLLHAVYRFSENERTWNVTPHYSRLVTIGETKIASEVALRLSKVFPYATLKQLQAVEQTVTDVDYLASSIFDAANLNRLVQPKDARKLLPLTKDQKATLVCAIIAELGWFVARTKATDRTHNNALFPPSDALILHVLAAHAVEEIMGDLIAGMFSVKSDWMMDLRKNWRNFETSMVEQVPFIATKKIQTRKVTSRGEVVEIVKEEEEFSGRFAEPVEMEFEKKLLATKKQQQQQQQQNSEEEQQQNLNQTLFSELHHSSLSLNKVPRSFESISEKEKKKIESSCSTMNDEKRVQLVAGLSDLSSGRSQGGFFSPSPMTMKWSNMVTTTTIAEEDPVCRVPGLEKKQEV